jgi:hypothetical protein
MPTPSAATLRSTASPAVSARLARSIRLRTLRRAGYNLTVESTDPGRKRLTVVVRGPIRSARGSRSRSTVLLVQRRSSFTGRTTLTLRLARKVRGLVKRGAVLSVRITVADADGRATIRTASVRVR